MKFNVSDWVIFDLKIGQIKEIRDETSVSFSDGMFETSGNLMARFRPLTLRGKSIVESFDYYYNEIRKIDGESGFNYPRISQYFSDLALKAIDNKDNEDNKIYFDKAREFINQARDYKPEIDGIKLFRPKVGF